MGNTHLTKPDEPANIFSKQFQPVYGNASHGFVQSAVRECKDTFTPAFVMMMICEEILDHCCQ
jgi:hypothetical protein